MTTAPHLSTNNSKTKVLSNLKLAYSSDGVSTLNMAGKVEALKLLCSSLPSHLVREAKMADYCPFHGLLTHWRQHNSRKVVIPASVPIQWLCSYLPFVAVALTRFEVQSHKSDFPLFCIDKYLAKMAKNKSKFVWSQRDYCICIAYKSLL